MSERVDPRCHRCGVVIGVYEPMVVVVRGIEIRTSRAAAGAELPPGEPWFHEECFAPSANAAPLEI